MGQVQHSNESGACARGRRLGWRICLCKDCGRRFQARSHNQRYCREPECLKELRRWQAAKRQQKCRAGPEGRRQHAEAERQRRQRKASEAGPQRAGQRSRDHGPPPPSPCARASAAAKNILKFFAIVPDVTSPCGISSRPGTLLQRRLPCGRRAARDRERKWLLRNREVGRFKRHLEYQAARVKRCCRHALSGGFRCRTFFGIAAVPAGCGPRLWVGKRCRAKLQGFSGGEPP